MTYKCTTHHRMGSAERCPACPPPHTPEERIEAMRQEINTAWTYLRWDGVPGLTPGEIQHRTNQAILSLREALKK